MSREDVRLNLASWEADSADYQSRNEQQLNRWDGPLGWGTWDISEDDVGALGDVSGSRALELGCGACQFGIKVARMGARVVGLDFSANQLSTARMNLAETGTAIPLVRASAEEIPFDDGSFDLVFCDHGATSFTDPTVTLPEVARVLRPGGRFVFNIATPFIWVFWGNDDEPAGRDLVRPYFGGGRTELKEDDGSVSVEWQLTYGDWIRAFRSSGFVVDDLIELRPPEDATTTYTGYATHDWARDYPAENIWKLRKEG
jgi:SAM-dependent methyltransferase